MSHAEAETPIPSSTYSADWADRRTMLLRWAGGGGATDRRRRRRRQWLSSIYNTHNQKGKDKERLRLRGGRRPHASVVSQNSSSKIGFLQRTSAATWADITKYHQATSVVKFDHSPVRPRPRSTSLPEDCVAAQRNMSPSHICPALRGLSRGPPLAVAFHTYL